MIQSSVVTARREPTNRPIPGLDSAAPVDGALFSARDRRLRHGVPLVVVGVLAFVVGIVVGGGGGGKDRDAAETYVRAWARGDTAAMYRLLDRSSRTAFPPPRFAALNRAARTTATVTRVRAGDASGAQNGRIPVSLRIRTAAFGDLPATYRLPVKEGKVHWTRDLVFPGLRAGERLSRRTRLPPRAAILARDGGALARGPDRTSRLGAVASGIVGELGTPRPATRARLSAQGYPRDANVGTSGLERIFEQDLAGRPGGTLRAGPRVIARSRPRAGRDVRSSIDPRLEQAAIDALAGRLGGAAALDPRTGEILALAGLAFSGLQPPGSTMKIITASAALEAGKVKLADTFPARSPASLEGVPLENANGESCGGTFLNSFAHSCNSVFAPLGAKVGAAKLVEVPEKFGFNEPLGIPGAATSRIPSAGAIGDDLAVGSSAIGQARVQATALQMAVVGGTIGAGGRRPHPTLRYKAPPRFTRAVPPRIARTLRRLMLAVVDFGTGTSAKIPGVRVAGKTGTAELQDTRGPGADQGGKTDAWFVAFAPALRPRVAVGVLLVEAGAGGSVAAPAARTVLQAGLKRR